MTTQSASNPSTSGATLNGTVTTDGGAPPLTDRGFYWKTSSGVTTSDTQLSEGGTTVAAFSKALGSLSVNTIYYYRAYAVNSLGTGIGASDVSFYTLANTPSAPTVGTPTTTTLTVAIGGSDGNPGNTTYAIKEAGGQYVQSGGALGASAVYQTASAWGTKTVTGLLPSTPYSFTVQAKNGDGIATGFGPSAGNTTSAGTTAPAVTTRAASSSTTSSATLNGTITADGGAAITDRGFYWQTTPTVTTSGTQLSEGGTSVAAFSKSLGSLSVNTIYYYRAYAANSVGTTLGGSDVSFCTLANTPSAPTVNNPTPSSLNVAITSGDGNPSATAYAIQETTSGNYVQTGGALGATAAYQTLTAWGTKPVTGLSPGTTYTFAVVATNGAGTASGFGSAASGTTQATPLAGWYGPWSGIAASPLDAPTKNPNLSSAQLARVGLSGSTSSARYSSSGWNATANYMTATLTAASGYVINLNGAALTGNWGSSSTGPASYDVRSSVDNYASSLGTVNSSTSIAYTSLTLPASGYNGLSSITFRFIGSATSAGGGSTGAGGTGGAASLYVGGNVGASTITGAAAAGAFSTTYGTASTPQTFSVSGANLAANLIATAPTGFEVSSDGTTYGTTATFTPSGGTVSGTLYVRLAATATVAGTYDSQLITLTSPGASEVDVTTAASGNAVSPATLTYTATAASMLYGGTVSSLSGTVSGFVNGENQALATAGTLAFNTPATSVSAGGTYDINGSGLTAANYTFIQAAGNATAFRINPAPGAFAIATTKNKAAAFPASKIIYFACDAGVTLSVGDFPATTTHGTVVFDGVTVTYTPTTPADYVGSDSFTYTISDNVGGSSVGTVTVAISEVNKLDLSIDSSSGVPTVIASGIPNQAYDLQVSDNGGISFTTLITTNAAGTGVIIYADTDYASHSSRMFRLAQH